MFANQLNVFFTRNQNSIVRIVPLYILFSMISFALSASAYVELWWKNRERESERAWKKNVDST